MRRRAARCGGLGFCVRSFRGACERASDSCCERAHPSIDVVMVVGGARRYLQPIGGVPPANSAAAGAGVLGHGIVDAMHVLHRAAAYGIMSGARAAVAPPPSPLLGAS